MAATARRFLLAGASGLIGTPLRRALESAGHEVRVLVRRAPRTPGEVRWDPAAGILDPSALDGVDTVVNLSGASIARLPWTRAYRRELLASRVDATRLLAETIVRVAQPPRAFLSGSAVGFYGDRPRETLDDQSPTGEGFLADLVLAWEQAAAIAAGATRVVALRTAVVVARRGGMAPVQLLTRFGLGASFGSGTQYWPWISLDDEVRAIVHLADSELSGPVLLAGPQPATADEVTRAFAEALHRPRLFRIPAFAVRLGLGEAGQHLLLDDAQVHPRRLADDGFAWRHPSVRDAVDAAVRSPTPS